MLYEKYHLYQNVVSKCATVYITVYGIIIHHTSWKMSKQNISQYLIQDLLAYTKCKVYQDQTESMYNHCQI